MKTILVDAINTFVIKWEWIYQPLYELLETYVNTKIILTNADDKEIEKFHLNEMPYDVFTLKHNPEKTDSTYFIKMLLFFNLEPQNVIYFEHSREAIESAKSAWIQTFYYDKDLQNIQALKKFLDQNI